MSDDELIRRGDALAELQLGDTMTKLQARVRAIPAMPFDAMTVERAALVVENDAGEFDHPATHYTFGRLARAIRALAPEPANVTAARVLLGHLENDAMTRAVSQEVWDQSCGEWQPSIPGAVEIIAAALRAIVEARHD